ncbi:MAG TPA: glycosyltransferase [bacterium]|nr:glycosyltransferase [bacterium]
MPLISVILPVYKPQKKFLTLAIQSILNQTYKNLELIIVEDKTELTNEQIIKNFSDSRIIYILNEARTDFARQINSGLKVAKGEFVARMDADDISEPNRLEKELNFLLSHPGISFVGSNLTIINEKNDLMGARFYPQNSLAIAKKMRLRNSLAHPTVMLRKRDLLDLGSYNQEFDTLADYDLWARGILAGLKYYNLPDKLLRYRLHSGAYKSHSLKQQLKDTLNIKKKYFRFKAGWSFLAEFRYWAEKILLFLPGEFIYWLFMKTNIK